MAQTDGKLTNFLTGPGEHGNMVQIRADLAAGVAEDHYFDGLKFLEPDNVGIFVSVKSTAGTPDTTCAVSADGQKITLTDAGGGTVNVLLVGKLGRI